jgi:hypothetical protein
MVNLITGVTSRSRPATGGGASEVVSETRDPWVVVAPDPQSLDSTVKSL